MTWADRVRLLWRWRNLPVRDKGLIVIAFPLVPLLATSALFYASQRQSDRADQWVAHTQELKMELAHALTLLVDAELGARGYLITHDPEPLATYRRANAALPDAFRRLTALTADDPLQRERLQKLPGMAKGRPLASIIEYADTAPSGAPLPLELLARSRRTMATLRNAIGDMQAAEDALLQQRTAEARATRRKGTIVAVGGMFVGLAGGIVATLLFTSGVARRIKDLTANAGRLASGDAPLPMADATDEIGTLDAALQRSAMLLRQHEAELNRRLAQKKAAMAELESFSYSVSHDLRAPLRHIVGFASLLEKSDADRLSEAGRRYLRTITDAAARMGRLVDDLLAFSRMGRAEMLHGVVDLDELVRDVVDEATSQVRERNVAWTVHPLPRVRGDRAMLRLALANLVSNALKYTSTRPRAEIEIGCESPSDGACVVYVRDNGVGFEMAYADKLFGVFQRLHSGDEFEGTGIGLANVRRVIQRHGGQTWAEGATDRGATFYFSLPSDGQDFSRAVAS